MKYHYLFLSALLLSAEQATAHSLSKSKSNSRSTHGGSTHGAGNLANLMNHPILKQEAKEAAQTKSTSTPSPKLKRSATATNSSSYSGCSSGQSSSGGAWIGSDGSLLPSVSKYVTEGTDFLDAIKPATFALLDQKNGSFHDSFDIDLAAQVQQDMKAATTKPGKKSHGARLADMALAEVKTETEKDGDLFLQIKVGIEGQDMQLDLMEHNLDQKLAKADGKEYGDHQVIKVNAINSQVDAEGGDFFDSLYSTASDILDSVMGGSGAKGETVGVDAGNDLTFYQIDEEGEVEVVPN